MESTQIKCGVEINQASHAANATRARPGWLDRLARRTVHKGFERIERGSLSVDDGRERLQFGRETAGEISAAITVRDGRFYRDALIGGTTGAAESYITGGWQCDDLADTLRLFARNSQVMIGMDSRWLKIAEPLQRVRQYLRKNTKSGSRKNISAHYDLGNDFFKLFLDETMMYSCAIFENENSTLKEASTAKNDRICRKLGLNAEHHIVEIGTGWGGFALHAAGQYGCHVTTVTISREQYDEATKRVREAGLQNLISVRFEDYRDLEGQYDFLVSIEMIEAVGHKFLDTYFRKCASLLKPHGAMLFQAITIQDQHHARHVRTSDFIKEYVFPGSCLPSLTSMTGAATRVTDAKLFHLEDITPHYAKTLRIWRQKLLAARDQVLALGKDDAFIRLWEYYFAYCEAGFAERYIGTVQAIFTRPDCRLEPVLPPLPSQPMAVKS